MQGALVLTRHDVVNAALRDDRLSSDPRHMGEDSKRRLDQLAPVFAEGAPGILLFLDPPDHTRLRRLVSKAFTPRSVERLRPHVTALVDGMLTTAAEQAGPGGTIDVMATVAEPLPVVVICDLLGIPANDHDDFKAWSTAIARMLDPIPDPNRLRKAVPAAIGMIQYFNELLEERASAPGDDLLSALLAVEAEGERLTHGELIALVVLLFIAGHETTTNLIGNGTLALLRNPDQYKRLVADPGGLARRAVEEALRYDAPVQMTARTATCDLDLHGVELAAGETVLLGIAAANRDERVWPDAESFLVDRDGPPPLSFGSGIHFCLGAGLARLEGQVVFEALARRFPDLSLAEEHPPYREHFVLRGLTRLDAATGSRVRARLRPSAQTSPSPTRSRTPATEPLVSSGAAHQPGPSSCVGRHVPTSTTRPSSSTSWQV